MWLETDIKLVKAHGGCDRVVKALDSKANGATATAYKITLEYYLVVQ